MKIQMTPVLKSNKNSKRSIFLLVVLMMGCTAKVDKYAEIPKSTAVSPVDSAKAVQAANGQIVYVPVYSHIPVGKNEIVSLRAILSIRNTSFTENLLVSRVEYFDTNGVLVKSHLQSPVSIGKMATMEVEVPAMDLRGGTGANFIVQWASEKSISTPIIESLMYGSVGKLSFSFLSRGQEIERH